MSKYRLSDIADGTYFFTVNSFRRQPVLTAELLRVALQRRSMLPPSQLFLLLVTLIFRVGISSDNASQMLLRNAQEDMQHADSQAYH